MSITDQLEEERHMLARLDQEDMTGTSTTVRDALTALPLRNAQVEAVLELCDPNFNLSIPDDIKRRFRRAIDEATA